MRLSPRTLVVVGALLAVVGGCNALFGIEDGTLAGTDGGPPGLDGASPVDGPFDGFTPPPTDGGSDTNSPSVDAPFDSPPTCGAHCAVAVSLGEAHGCALLGNGTVSCWGDDTFAQLGNNVFSADAGQPDPTTPKSPPSVVNGLSGVTAIATGAGHTCVLAAGGTVYCWGFDDLGECGDGRALFSANSPHQFVGVPTQVPGITGASSIRAHGESTCVGFADGSMQCWGANLHGGLGSASPAGDQACQAQNIEQGPCTPSPQPCQQGSTFSAFDVGYLHSCAIGADGGPLQCWGDDEVGELGVNLDGGSTLSPVEPPLPKAPALLATGISHTCSVVADGTLYCWGVGAEGQLGAGNDTSNSSPTLALTPPAVTVTSLSAGYYNTVIGLSDGTVACSGIDNAYQCGVVATDNCPNANFAGPCNLSFRVVPNVGDVKSVASGFLATCVLNTSGQVYCWGDDAYGELGDGQNGAVDGGFFRPVLTPQLVSF